MSRRGALIPALALLIGVRLAAEQRPRFETGVTAVEVEVSVDRDRRPVTDLTVKDFELFDDGVRQALVDATLESRALQLAIAVDTSASATGDLKTAIRRGLTDAVDLAQPGDRVELYALASRLRRIATVSDLDLATGPDGAHTALIDGLAALMLSPPQPPRRRAVVVLTDGIDTNSVISRSQLLTLAGRSASFIHVVAIDDGSGPFQLGAEHFEGYAWILPAITGRTGGRFARVAPRDQLRSTLQAMLDPLRRMYVLRFVPQGVRSAGWHELRVRLTRPGRFTIHARTGYEAGRD